MSKTKSNCLENVKRQSCLKKERKLTYGDPMTSKILWPVQDLHIIGKGPTWSINTTLRSPIWSLLSLGQKEKEKMSLLTILEDMERNPLAYG